MNYFDYQPKVPMGRVWSLFSQLADMSESEKLGKYSYSPEYSHTLEIVKAATTGSLSRKEDVYEDFNLRAYEASCKRNETINFKKSLEKCLFIVDNVSSDGETKTGYGDISENKIRSIEDAFVSVESLSSFESNIDMLLNIRVKYIESQGIDLVSILVNSLKGIPDAIEGMAEFVKTNLQLKELIVDLCQDGKDGKLLARLATVV